jgi:hypothetical protein
MRAEYYAHSLKDRPVTDWERLEDHLAAVAKLAKTFAAKFDAADWGELADLANRHKREHGFEAKQSLALPADAGAFYDCVRIKKPQVVCASCGGRSVERGLRMLSSFDDASLLRKDAGRDWLHFERLLPLVT